MTPEPQRLQYLEAMGLTAWVARYALPNARPTPACRWELPEARPTEAPGERLHALLDEAAREAPSEAPAPPARERSQRPAGPGKARALLGTEPDESRAVLAPSRDSLSPAESVEPLRFAFQAACLEGRWLVLLAGKAPPGRPELKLLANLFRAAGIEASLPDFQAFRWPLEEGLAVDEPLEEARQGLQAFVAGARRRGWAPQRLLLFGEDHALDRVLSLQNHRCPLLDLPAWQGPSLEALAGSGEAKRMLLPQLLSWGTVWRESAEESPGEP